MNLYQYVAAYLMMGIVSLFLTSALLYPISKKYGINSFNINSISDLAVRAVFWPFVTVCVAIVLSIPFFRERWIDIISKD